jgi:inner membrane protein involved in colicin E2 resistance
MVPFFWTKLISFGLFIILAVVMYLTRRIDWFTVLKPNVND